ncbi:UvrD-helicase domain-containing protein [Streptomyces sp. NPDC057116]|uniref:UvrD-helicase domain-containing protein n=1 Tax=Streptomyces sp. NPDC057116 TaxID=3346023 RepID=UPI003624E29B
MEAERTLSELVSSLAAMTGLQRIAVIRRLNQRVDAVTQPTTPAEVVQQAIMAAEEWIVRIETNPPQSGVPSPAQPTIPISTPTHEQQHAVDAKRSGDHLVLQAGAGTGKTTTLRMLAASDSRRAVYLAYNRSIVDDAVRGFPSHVACHTGHSLALREVGHLYSDRLSTPREPSWKVGLRIGIAPHLRIRLGDRVVTNKTLAYTVFRTVKRFCYSADTEIEAHHVPRLRGLETDNLHAVLVEVVLPYARRAWEDLQNPNTGVVKFEHDHYLKIWALKEPQIRADYLLLDEAQDTNPVLEKVFTAQRSHAQLVLVGDSAQAIYGWRGARDVMSTFDGRQLTLSQSFRFGPALATEANRWLSIVRSPLRLQGTPSIETTIGALPHPAAVLCRTNAGTVIEILKLLAENKRVALNGGGRTLDDLARAAADLKAGRRTTHPELVLFQSWGELQEYANDDPAGRDLLPLVEIVDEYGVEVILQAVRCLDREEVADVTVSTAHKAKGRQWSTVRIAQDFEPSPPEESDTSGAPSLRPLNIDEARLAYVAVTRARHHLDLGGPGLDQLSPQRHPHPRPPDASSAPAPSAVPLGPPRPCPKTAVGAASYTANPDLQILSNQQKYAPPTQRRLTTSQQSLAVPLPAAPFQFPATET